MTLPQTIENLAAGQEETLLPRKHVLDLDDYSREELAATLESAHGMAEVLGRDIKKTPALRGRVIVTLFYEASTRTRVSFEEAGKILSADVINMSASGSSADKGESLLNTGLTLQAMGVDTLVVRHPSLRRPQLPGPEPGAGQRGQRRRRPARPSHSSAARLVHRSVPLGPYRGPEGGHRGRRAAQSRGPLQHLGIRRMGARVVLVRPPHADAPGFSHPERKPRRRWTPSHRWWKWTPTSTAPCKMPMW